MTDMIKPLYILMILAVITSCVFTEDTERVVTIDSNEKAFGCNSFEFIDSQTFKIDNIIYSLNNNHLEVTGYDKRFEGKARFISALNYHGIEYKTTVIDSHAFSNCETLTDIDIPKSITHIGEFAFYGCTNLKEFSFPRKTRIIHSVFRNCDSLETIFLPREVTKIDCEFKYSCKNLKRIVIPKGSRQKFEKLIERKYHYLIVEK